MLYCTLEEVAMEKVEAAGVAVEEEVVVVEELYSPYAAH